MFQEERPLNYIKRKGSTIINLYQEEKDITTCLFQEESTGIASHFYQEKRKHIKRKGQCHLRAFPLTTGVNEEQYDRFITGGNVGHYHLLKSGEMKFISGGKKEPLTEGVSTYRRE